MAKQVRYGSYLRELASQQRWIVIRSARDLPRWLTRLREPGSAILCLGAILALFPLLILREAPAGGLAAAAGLALLLAGIALFREGVRTGLLPLGDTFGRAAAARLPLVALFGLALLLGLSVSLVEPVIAALQLSGARVEVQHDPYLHLLLHQRPGALLAIIALCTGAAVMLGTLRSLQGWSLRPLLLAALIPAVGLSGHLLFDPELSRVPALAWDCGALAGGPVTALLLLAFGTGAAGAAGGSRPALPGFGMLALATILPVLGVLVWAMILAETTSVEGITAAAATLAGDARHVPTLRTEFYAALLALGPLTLLFYLCLHFLFRDKQPWSVTGGLILALLGLGLLNAGVTRGLGALADQAGTGIETLLLRTDSWPAPLGVTLVAVLLGALAWQAARAEPALNAFARVAETHTHGVLRQPRLLGAVAAGAGAGALAGVPYLVAGFDPTWVLIGGWLVALLLAAAAGEECAAAAWDGAGMMSGPLTVAVLVPTGAGIARHLDAPSVFGLPALCALGSVLAVLGGGVLARVAHARRRLIRNAGFATP